MNNVIRHIKTVGTHRRYVRSMCFKMGLYWQGLTHDLSKYGFTEMRVAKYADGRRSPHEVCREKIGYSPSWNHHYHKNKHHWQFWLDDICANGIISIKMPYKYVIEMFCDMTGASKAYRKEKYEIEDPYRYYKKSMDLRTYMHEESQRLLVFLFEKYCAYGEKEFFKWYRTNKRWIKGRY